MQEREPLNSQFEDLVEIIRFTESVAAKIHGLLDKEEICRAVIDESAKSKKHNVAIYFLTSDESKLSLVDVSLAHECRSMGEKIAGIRLKEYLVEVDKSKVFRQVIREGKTVEANFVDVLCEYFPAPLARLVAKVIGYDKRSGIITPLKQKGKTTGMLVIDSTELTEYFIPSVKNLAQHISTAMDMAEAEAEQMRMQEKLRRANESLTTAQSIAHLGNWDWDIAANEISCSEEYYRILGVNPKDYNAFKDFEKLIHPDDGKTHDRAMKDALSGKAPYDTVYRIICLDGEVKWLHVRGSIVLNEKGKPVRLRGTTLDITKQKQMEIGLRESEERFRSLIQNSSDIVLLLNDKGFIRYLSPSVGRILGYTLEEISGKNVFEYVHPDDVQRAKSRFEYSIRNPGAVVSLEVRVKHANGSWLCFEAIANNLLIDSSMKGIVVNARDITERKRVEETLRESEDKYRGLVESSPNIVGILQDGTLKYVNKAGERMGWTLEEALSPSFHPIKTVISNEFAELVKENVVRRLKGESIPPYEINIKKRDGSEIPVTVFSERIIYQGMPALEFIFADITERKWMETQLRRYSEQLEELVEARTKELTESEERFRRMFEETSMGVATINRDFRIERANPAMCRMLGYAEEELQKLTFLDITHPDDMEISRKRTEQIFRDEVPDFKLEKRYIKKNGETLWARLTVTMIHDENGRPLYDIALIEDITQQKEMQEKLLKAQRLATIGEVAAMVGHDLRNPLQAVTNIVYLARERLKNMPASPGSADARGQGPAEYLKIIEEQVAYMDKIVSDLQDYARPMELQPIETDLRGLIDKIISTIAISENIQVSIEVGEEFSRLMLDPMLMKRVLVNLIMNAVQAMPSGGRLSVSASKTGADTLISIADTGVGISEESKARLFQPLFTTKAKGTGLGLSVCKRLMEIQGGDITVESKVGVGSTFTVRIPLPREVSGHR